MTAYVLSLKQTEILTSNKSEIDLILLLTFLILYMFSSYKLKQNITTIIVIAIE